MFWLFMLAIWVVGATVYGLVYNTGIEFGFLEQPKDGEYDLPVNWIVCKVVAPLFWPAAFPVLIGTCGGKVIKKVYDSYVPKKPN